MNENVIPPEGKPESIAPGAHNRSLDLESREWPTWVVEKVTIFPAPEIVAVPEWLKSNLTVGPVEMGPGAKTILVTVKDTAKQEHIITVLGVTMHEDGLLVADVCIDDKFIYLPIVGLETNKNWEIHVEFGPPWTSN